MRSLEVVVGAQFGSEAKGHVVQRLTERAHRENRHPHVIRVAGPNAGHTGYDATGTSWALRQIPVAAVTEGHAILGIAAGSEIDLPVLLDEYDRLKDAGLMRNKFLWVHGEATMIYDKHKATEVGNTDFTGDDLVTRVGSTGKGIGAARADRLMRTGYRLVDDEDAMEALAQRGIPVAEPWQHIPSIGPDHIIIEGTQGYGLGLRAGHYPQCTSSDCRAMDFLAMAGVSPWEFQQIAVWAVARVYPIRVAGNSGPLKGETTWEALGLPEERTTVTKKVRRVGEPDWELVRRAVIANGGSPTVRVALTMADQMFPELRDKQVSPLDGDLHTLVKEIERTTNAAVKMITTGPNTATFI